MTLLSSETSMQYYLGYSARTRIGEEQSKRDLREANPFFERTKRGFGVQSGDSRWFIKGEAGSLKIMMRPSMRTC